MSVEHYYEVLRMLPTNLQATLRNVPEIIARGANEIRLRAARPLALICGGQTLFPDKFGACSEKISSQLPKVSQKELEETLLLLCQGSIYCHQEEIAQGYISLPGGHRAGICGMGVLRDGQIENVKEISSINIRIAKQVIGCAVSLSKQYVLGGLIIAGPPGSGKTTLLRDIIRRCSSGDMGEYMRVALADERGEISAMCQGRPGLDISLADVICGIPKAQAVMMAVRTLNPQIVAFDEIGDESDTKAVAAAASAGVDFIATIHADSMECLMKNRLFFGLQDHTKNVILLDKMPGKIKRIYNLEEIKDEISRSRYTVADGNIYRASFGRKIEAKPAAD